MERIGHRGLALGCTLAAAAALGTAFASEWWGGLVPCALCLLERWPYRIAIGLGLFALVVPARWGRIVLGALGLVMLGGAALGLLHVGVEHGWWPSPLPECAAPRLTGGSIAERLAQMPARPAKPCDEPVFLLPGLPLSMAAMNGVFALAFAACVLIFLVRTRTRDPI